MEKMNTAEMLNSLVNTPLNSDMTYAQERCQILNADVGHLHEVDGYECTECKNKGCIYIPNGETEVMSRACPKCSKIRSSLFSIAKSGLGEYEFSNFTVSERGNWEENLLTNVVNYVRCNGNHWLYVSGQQGSGKTHICTAALKNLIFMQDVTGLVLRWVDDSKRLKRFTNDDSIETEIAKYKNVPLLYIDDFFKGNTVTSADINLAFDIIDYRYTKKLITVISSEKSIDEIINIDEALGGRIKQRAKNYTYHIRKDRNKDHRLKD